MSVNVPHAFEQANPSLRDCEFVVHSSASRLHVINVCESVDENIERILLEQNYSHKEVKDLIQRYTFKLHVNGMTFDARDSFEILELSRRIPNLYPIKMYMYTAEEFKCR